MEKLVNTLEHFIKHEDVSIDMWSSILLQVIFTLIIYQDLFSLTHNDLHSSNIMYTYTDKQFIIYKYKGIYYKIPTFGKIWKIIDFGRSIFKYKNIQFCSNSFSEDGDASTQYNFPPFYNPMKKEVIPNYSFDLSRLGCSLIDYFYECTDDFSDDNNDDIQKLILEWCKDDKQRNIVYKSDGEERYPEFKLYKMIARQVHNHTPHSQLDKDIFKQYIVSKKNVKKHNYINIDDIIEKILG
jgi:hypothetical protein